MKVVGIIPARGGSKKVLNKNLKKFYGKPLIAWTILTAKKSGKLNRVIISTDSPTIAKVARRYGAETPFLRPAELAIDTIGIEPTLKHAYQWLVDNEGYQADALALLMPTNPLRQIFHIDEAVTIFKKEGADSVVAVNQTPANHTPFWTLVNHENKVCLFGGVDLKNIFTRRQDFPHQCYARNDLIYVLKPKNLFEDKPNLYGQKIKLYETSPLYEIDINVPEDWLLAELHFKQLQKLNKR